MSKKRVAKLQSDIILKTAEKLLVAKFKRYKGYPCVCGTVLENHSNTKCQAWGYFVPMGNIDYIKWKANPQHRVKIKTVSDYL
jgi:hypothetical protein